MQAAEKDIRDRRYSREAGILVTGVTGFLGSHLMVAFLKRGYPVMALCRPKGGVEAAERIDHLLKWFGTRTQEARRLIVVEAFLDQPNLGLDQEQYASLMERTDEVFHCAADTSFAEKRRARVEAANLKGLGFLLDMALAGRCRFFHYVSTTYAAGRGGDYCQETHVETRDFTNIYEETKHRAEKMVLDACMAIMEEAIEGDIFHIVGKDLKSLDDLVDYTRRFFKITGIRTVDRNEFDIIPKNAFDILFSRYIDIYQPYMRDTRVFGSEKADAILGKKGIRCPGFDYDVFERCMTYAVEMDWGKRLYDKGVLVSQRGK